MANILIGYDLNKNGQNYRALIQKIESLSPKWWHCLDSTWIIQTNLTPMQVLNALQPLIDSNDELLVMDITGDSAAWIGFDTQCSDWLSSSL